MNSFNRILLLLWKNFKLKLRQPLVSLVELSVPCLFSVILVIVRVVVTFDQITVPTEFFPNPIKYGSAFSRKTIIFTPKNPETEAIMQILLNITRPNTISVNGFDDEDEMVAHYLKKDSEEIRCGVVFNSWQRNRIDFRLRFPFVPVSDNKFNWNKIEQFTWKTSRNFPLFQEPGPRSAMSDVGGPPDYYHEGFLYLQHQLSEAVALYNDPQVKTVFDNVRINVQRFPYPPYDNDKFLFSLQFMFPLILMLSFIYPSVNLTKNIVLEKEMRLKEAMRMMGLENWLHWTTWFINSFIWSMISVAIITALLCTPVKDSLGIISKSNAALVLLFFIAYTISSIMFCFLMSTFFSKANIAGIVAGAIYFASFLPYFQVNMNYHELTFSMKMAISLIFNTNMALGCMLISMWESNHVGLQWSNIMEPASPDDNLTFFYILLMFTIDSIIYFLLAVYINNVFPGEYGLAKKWYFFAQSSYWCGSGSNQSQDEPIEMARIEEEIGTDQSSGIQIVNLSKSYDHGKTFAVDSLSLDMKQNEITVLLGHNGAGKTTLMSILCGLIPPTSGQVLINKFNLSTEIDKIRHSLGICPQFDVLFDHLTVKEHLWFYCKLKNVPNDIIEKEIETMIKLLDLVNKRDKQAYTLSGGMKRKLSVGIALIGGSKVVLLDEPTSGMDVASRRYIWNLLIRARENRTMLLSTHFMEEADVLGDKIAIVSKGQVKCQGPPLSLKKDYGLGYILTLAVNEDQVNLPRISDLIRSHIHNANMLTSVGTEITWSLPTGESGKFEILFKTIEQNMDKLGITNFGISVTTLEEVFLRVGDFAKQGAEQFNNFNKTNESKNQNAIEKIKHNSLELNEGFLRFIQIYWSLLVKKILFTYRNLFLLFAQFILPGLLLTVGILTNRNQMDKTIYSPAMQMSLHSFKKVYVTSFADQAVESGHLADLYYKTLSEAPMVLADKMIGDRISNRSIQHLVNFGTKHEAEYNLFYLLSALFESTDNGTITATAMFNNQAYHSIAMSVAYLDATLLKYALNDSQLSLAVWNEPFPRKRSDILNAREFDSTLEVQLSNQLQFSICFLLASFVILLVKEKTANFKHIQQISGLRLFQYWTSNFLLDYISYILSSLVLAAVIYILDVKAFATFEQQGRLIAVFVTFGLSALPFIYLLSIFFQDPATAYVRISLYLIILGTCTFLMVLILQIPDFDLRDTSDVLDYIFALILPIYTVAMSIFSLHQNHISLGFCLSNFTVPFLNATINIQEDLCKDNATLSWVPQLRVCCKDVCEPICLPFEEDYWAWKKPGIGRLLASFAVQAVVLWLLLSFFEANVWHKLTSAIRTWIRREKPIASVESEYKVDPDNDVLNEADRIKRRSYFTLFKTDSMVVQNVSKKYGQFRAVNNVSFGVKKGECFGVLGVNGAGKTTMFKMITGAEKITRGDILINGNNVKTQMSKVFKDIGYCPQFDGLLEHLTGRETLKIISRIRGIKEPLIDPQIDALGRLLFFEEHVDKAVGSYSGGTKRKLSFAISIVGNPLITFLDEPTTGVDPVSRRCLWNAIQLVRAAGSSLVLTSHSMEECEALCNRLVIMVNGKISCLGSPLHLKQKYGAGYVIHIKLKSKLQETEKAAGELNEFMCSNFAECRIESVHNNLFTFLLETNQLKLSTLFGQIESVKAKLNIEDYSIYQTSLERIFLSLVRSQKSE